MGKYQSDHSDPDDGRTIEDLEYGARRPRLNPDHALTEDLNAIAREDLADAARWAILKDRNPNRWELSSNPGPLSQDLRERADDDLRKIAAAIQPAREHGGTVIRDRRPTRAEVEAATMQCEDGRISRFIRTCGDWPRLMLIRPISCWWKAHIDGVAGCWIDIRDGRISDAGETWRPINPDGSPMTLNLEVSDAFR